MKRFEVMRATEEWQRAGAYSVRIQGMNRQYNIPLREEFDEKDGEGTKYVVLLDDGYPMATCRFYEVSPTCVSLGRVVVLPEYRDQGVGKLLLSEAEKWASELGYREVEVDSRIQVVGFYEKFGYKLSGTPAEKKGFFNCIKMEKALC